MPPVRHRPALGALLLAVLAVVVSAPVSGSRPSTQAAAASCPAAVASPLRAAPGSGRTVALTFDDGPGPYTPQVLEVLRRKGVRATFFLMAEQTEIWPEYARQVADEGHLVGNHTYTHPDLRTLSAAQQAAELDRAGARLEAVTGRRPCVFRPPYGSYDTATLAVARARGLRTWLWTTDTRDWAAPPRPSASGRDAIVREGATGRALRHPTVLLHDGGHDRPNLVSALPRLIDVYRAAGYRFVDLQGRSGLAPPPADRVAWRRSPRGDLEQAYGGRGQITVSGWASDPDDPSTPREVVLRIAGRERGRVEATLARPLGGAHGFAVTVPAPRGRTVVCAFATNTGPGATAGLGCRAVQVD